ncbi:hypothetical protein Y1Q_0023257 [Alligator mississippiensis]|uniref:Uncharacterized protein n=1 Tax=Alligator mississippiensis TaxID=8496 RepID=A0A151MJ57_ALLMI|nr:hypothetical protein Y1Q_0023257 [Alligator mississippiensis]
MCHSWKVWAPALETDCVPGALDVGLCLRYVPLVTFPDKLNAAQQPAPSAAEQTRMEHNGQFAGALTRKRAHLSP